MEDYKGVKEGVVGGTVWSESEKAITRLEEIQMSMEKKIRDIRGELDEDIMGDEFRQWSPFQVGEILSGREAEYGWTGELMETTKVEDIFKEEIRYEEFAPEREEFIYDPDYVPTLLLSHGEIKEKMLEDLAKKPVFDPTVMTISDLRVKKDITRISRLNNGIPVYLFRYKWSDSLSVGVMAQDVERVIPEAVVTIDGVKAVNYSMLRG